MAGGSALTPTKFRVASAAKRMTGPAVVIAITAIIVTSLYRNKPEPEVGEAAINRIGVYVERATRTGARAEVTVYGEVRPRVQIDVISEVSGRVTRVSPRFIEGGSIGAGGALLTIEDRDYVLAVSEARARLAARRLELEQALADADVAKKQLAGEANPSDLALKKPQIAQARAGLQAAELSLARAESDLSHEHKFRFRLTYASLKPWSMRVNTLGQVERWLRSFRRMLQKCAYP